MKCAPPSVAGVNPPQELQEGDDGGSLAEAHVVADDHWAVGGPLVAQPVDAVQLVRVQPPASNPLRLLRHLRRARRRRLQPYFDFVSV